MYGSATRKSAVPGVMHNGLAGHGMGKRQLIHGQTPWPGSAANAMETLKNCHPAPGHDGRWHLDGWLVLPRSSILLWLHVLVQDHVSTKLEKGSAVSYLLSPQPGACSLTANEELSPNGSEIHRPVARGGKRYTMRTTPMNQLLRKPMSSVQRGEGRGGRHRCKPGRPVSFTLPYGRLTGLLYRI